MVKGIKTSKVGYSGRQIMIRVINYCAGYLVCRKDPEDQVPGKTEKDHGMMSPIWMRFETAPMWS
jgi:hypothetical protein